MQANRYLSHCWQEYKSIQLFWRSIWQFISLTLKMGFQAALVVKNLPANAGDRRYTGSIPGSERSPGGGDGNPLQYSCLDNPTDRGAWRATVHEVAKSRTWLKRLSMHAHTRKHALNEWMNAHIPRPQLMPCEASHTAPVFNSVVMPVIMASSLWHRVSGVPSEKQR